MDSMQIRDDEGYVPRCRECAADGGNHLPGCPGRDTGSAMMVEARPWAPPKIVVGTVEFRDELGELLVRHGHAAEWSQVYYALPEVAALIEAVRACPPVARR